MNTLWQDVRYGARMLRKHPSFTIVAILALGLGIGANTAIFSVINAVLLRPLPFQQPERLVAVLSVNLREGGEQFGGASPADFLDWRKENTAFEAITAYSGGGFNLVGGEQPEQFYGARVSEDFFKVFDAKPILGRTILPEENSVRGNRVVILSHRLWQRRFGGDAGVIGKTLTTAYGSSTVVGVMPPDFKEPGYAEVWTPLLTDTGEMKPRESRYFTVAARLNPGVSMEQAQTEMTVLAERLAAANPETNSTWGVRLLPLHERGVTGVRPALLILLGAVLFVLLIACANVANLLLARASARGKEVAVRTAMGATRGRIVRGLLVESLILALLGGGAGLLFAMWGVDAITALVPSDWRFPRLDESRIDLTVLGFTFGVSVLTGLVFGLLPALKVSNPNVYEALKETGRGATAGMRVQRLRGLLVVCEIALTLLLLVGAGLLMKSLLFLQHADLGFDSRNISTANISVPLNKKYSPDEARSTLYQRILEEVAKSPDVEAVAASSGPPLVSFGLNFAFEIEGRASAPGDKREAFYSAISPGYFRALGVSLRTGREFTERDAKDAPPVVVINETMARRFFPGTDPIGKQLKIKHYQSDLVAHEIVGVVGDTKQVNLFDETEIEMYVSHLQQPWLSTVLVVRTRSSSANVDAIVRRAVAAVDKNLPVAGVKTIEELTSESIAQPRFYTLLLGIFAAIALLIAGVGIYGVMNYTVSTRAHEIGVRMALGAQKADVLRLVIGEGMRLTVVGVLLGLAAALALTRVMSSLLYGVGATDLVTFIVIPLVLAAVAFLASYIPARRATKVDPMIALRYE